ncbi:MAG: 50S ribosomal protein L25 [Anaerolineae bacterium]|nr:50S ribosomal protein L25 [Anaerolineae bacterium]
MEAIQLHAEPRTVIGKKVKLLRHKDIIPGIIYSRHIDPIAVQFDKRELTTALNRAGTSATLQVDVAGSAEPYLVIFRDIQHHTILRDVFHVDLQALSLTEIVRVPVNIVLIGIAPAVETDAGVVMQTLQEVEIEALPLDLIPFIEVDISILTEIGSSISVGDLEVPAGVTILSNPEVTIVQVTYEALEEVEEEELEEDLLGEPLADGEEGAEGAEDTEEAES